MRKILISAALLSAALVANPAAAQHYGGYGNGAAQQIRHQLAQLDDRIERARERRVITRREARRLDNRVDNIRDRFRSYRRNGLSHGEMRELRDRIQNVRAQLREDRHDGRRRWN